MRSTMQITANNTILNLHKANARYNTVVNQIATGQKVNKPSDDALATTEGMRLSNVVARLEQYNRNITNTGYSFLNLSESALSSVNKLMTTAKSLAIESASDTTSSSRKREATAPAAYPFKAAPRSRDAPSEPFTIT